MRWILGVLAIVGVALVAFAIYVRLASTDVARWHVPLGGSEDRLTGNSALRIIPGDSAVMVRLDAAMRGLPRTNAIAGGPQDGRMTYVTRSQWWRFPDFTTVELDGDRIRLFARSRFGALDYGVNAERLERVLRTLE